jgi:hypothetical protein
MEAAPLYENIREMVEKDPLVSSMELGETVPMPAWACVWMVSKLSRKKGYMDFIRNWIE